LWWVGTEGGAEGEETGGGASVAFLFGWDGGEVGGGPEPAAWAEAIAAEGDWEGWADGLPRGGGVGSGEAMEGAGGGGPVRGGYGDDLERAVGDAWGGA
jgi:hypothetical protein